MNTWQIFKTDVKNIFKNYAAIIVVIALCILPSLYAWFNIKASWDPYSEAATSGIKVAVINKDQGTNLNNTDINLGKKVVEELQDNNQMGWQFVSEQEAIDNLKEGKYYAMITIPENFSKDLTSIITSNIKKGDIIYTVNEKINAIAPKLTDKGATGVGEKISKELISTVSDAIFGIGNEIGKTLETQIPKISVIYNSLEEVQSHFTDINKTVALTSEASNEIKGLIGSLQKDIPTIEKTLTNAKTLAINLQDFIGKSKDGVEQISPVIKNDIGIINGLSQDIVKYSTAIKTAIENSSSNAPELINNLILKLNLLENTTDGLIKVLEALNKISFNKPLNGLISNLQNIRNMVSTARDQLVSILDNVNNGEKPDLSILNSIITISNNISNITQRLYNNFDSEISNKIITIFNDAYKVAENALVVIKNAQEKLPQVKDILSDANLIADKGIKGLAFIKENLPKAEAMINDMVTKLGQINDDADINEVIELLKADVTERSDFLSNPVNIVENKLFPMENYGTSMTPFYTVLSLWVGLLLLSSIFKVEAHGDYSHVSQYFGKLLLFMSIAVIQGLIVALGDLYILKIYCVNPFLFILGSILTSAMFTFIVYSLVSVFGNVGKVIGIILLVLQVAGSGGTFPIQLTPNFFQVLYPFLPFTYAISFAREAIGGVVNIVLAKDILMFVIYSVLSVLVALFLKKPINTLSAGFNESFKKSDIGE